MIDRAVRTVYRPYLADPKPENVPILEDLYDEILRQPEPEAKRIAAALELYVHGSLNVFNHRTNVDINNRLVCFDIKELGKQLKNLGMLVIQDQVWNRVTVNRSEGKARMDFRSRRRCGNVRKLPVPAALWETCLQNVGKACPFPCAVNGFSIGASGSFPHFHDAYFYPTIRRYMVNGTYRAATTRRQTRIKPPITPPMIKFNANSAIPPPKEPPPGTIQRHIRWRPKGSPQSIQSHT